MDDLLLIARLGIAGEVEDSGKKFHCERTGTSRAKVERDLGLRYFCFVF